nr:carotenoid oxygenase family protein [Nocardia brasiliensis]
MLAGPACSGDRFFQGAQRRQTFRGSGCDLAQRGTGARTTHEFGAGRVSAEAVFAPADQHAGSSGYLMSFVYNATSEQSDLVILRADDLAAAPVATVHLPQRVPFGFHGSWLPDV